MGWARHAIEQLQRGQAVRVTPRGHSMAGKVEDGDYAVQGERYLIGNNRGGINGWVSRQAIFGRATRIEHGRR
jgi:hypothetical protein